MNLFFLQHGEHSFDSCNDCLSQWNVGRYLRALIGIIGVDQQLEYLFLVKAVFDGNLQPVVQAEEAEHDEAGYLGLDKS